MQSSAIGGKTKCRFHGGRSTGATTAEGKTRIAAAHTVHGKKLGRYVQSVVSNLQSYMRLSSSLYRV